MQRERGRGRERERERSVKEKIEGTSRRTGRGGASLHSIKFSLKLKSEEWKVRKMNFEEKSLPFQLRMELRRGRNVAKKFYFGTWHLT